MTNKRNKTWKQNKEFENKRKNKTETGEGIGKLYKKIYNKNVAKIMEKKNLSNKKKS